MMKAGLSISFVAKLSADRLVVLVIFLGLGFVATVLAPGLRLSSQLVNTSAALKWVADQERYPTIIRASLETMRDRLTNRGYLQESVDQLTDSTKRFGDAVQIMTTPRAGGWLGVGMPGSVGDSIAGGRAGPLRDAWAKELGAVQPVLAFNGVPYADSESQGTVLNATGRQLEHDLTTAIRISRHSLPELESELTAVGAQLQAGSARAARQLQIVMLAGLLIAAGLVLLIVLLLNARSKQEARLREARQQTADILRTVKDGLFLLDENLIIGAAYSAALETLFQRKDFAGLPFESLLKNIVSERTLATALKFVKILWAERTNEKLVKTINPLGEVEVHLDVGNGKFETRYLQFDFHRVRVDGEMTQVLVSVSDVSARVDLAHELQASQSQAQGQVDTLLGILHIDPVQLASFLNDSNAAMKMINAVLREPTREEGVFRKKLDTLFRQVHAVKGESAALGLAPIESRGHAFEDDLKSLKEKPALSGNDFLPLVIKLDDLLTHLQSVSDLVARLSRLQHSAHDVAHTVTAVIDAGRDNTGKDKQKPIQPAANADGGLAVTLQQLTARVAREKSKEAVLQCVGFDGIPDDFRRAVKDIGVQAVRNAIVHGIEPPAARLAAGKSLQGVVRLTFQDLRDGSYKLIVED